jgi:CheY-like chemotaxis protein
MNANMSTILLVEDECEIRALVKACLEHAGYAVLAATDGIEGVSVYRQHQSEIALLLTDVMMPNMNGLELADCVLALDSRLPVLFISGNAPSADRGYGCVAKPFTSAALVNRVRQALSRNTRPTQTKTQAA